MPTMRQCAFEPPRQFTGLTASESRYALCWIRAHAHEYQDAEFSFHLGEGIELGPGFDEATRRAARLNSQKRADLLAHGTAGVAIVEIKDRIGPHALGQLLVYRELYQRRPSWPGPVRLYAVGPMIAPDIAGILEAAGILVELYPGP